MSHGCLHAIRTDWDVWQAFAQETAIIARRETGLASASLIAALALAVRQSTTIVPCRAESGMLEGIVLRSYRWELAVLVMVGSVRRTWGARGE